MPGKRRKTEQGDTSLRPAKTPLSAIAAARAQAEATVETVCGPNVPVEPIALQSTPEINQSTPEEALYSWPRGETSEGKQDDPSARRCLRLCSWRNDPSHILADTESELCIHLDKHTTIALIGCFQFKVLRGAIHINGANIGAVDRAGQKHTLHCVYASATHPVLKIRGLNATNHVQFFSCKEPAFLTSVSPLFEDLWRTRSIHKPDRSFTVVSHHSPQCFGVP